MQYTFCQRCVFLKISELGTCCVVALDISSFFEKSLLQKLISFGFECWGCQSSRKTTSRSFKQSLAMRLSINNSYMNGSATSE